jgi:hypothetical protein
VAQASASHAWVLDGRWRSIGGVGDGNEAGVTSAAFRWQTGNPSVRTTRNTP